MIRKRTYYFIYKTTNLINGKIYVGRRKTKNLDDNYLGSGKLFKRAIEKYGQENFTREILQFCDDKKHLNECEIYWIAELNATNKKVGYNIGRGGEGSNIEHHSQTTKNKMSISRVGKPCAEETKKKIGIKNSGKIRSKELRELWSKLHKGHSPGNKCKKTAKETIQKQKKTLANKPFIVCPHCGLQSKSPANIKRYHFDNCKQNPNIIVTEETLKKKEIWINKIAETLKNKPIETCPFCGLQSNSVGIKQYHFDNCKMSPNYIPKTYVCPHCGFLGHQLTSMKHWHFDNCKFNPNKNIINTKTKTG